MFTFEQKRDEAKRAAAELRRRMTMRVHRHRKSQAAADLRLAIADEIVADYERAIERRAAVKPTPTPAQYLLNLTKGGT